MVASNAVGIIVIVVLCILCSCISSLLGWYYSPSLGAAGEAADTALGGQRDPNFCQQNKCFNNCVAWSEIPNNADYYCHTDLGEGWKGTENRSQADCSVGLGKSACVLDETRLGMKYMKNCVTWNDIETNGSFNCYNDYGPGWVYAGIRDQGGCSAGLGRGLCRLEPARQEQRYMENCTAWAEIPNNGNYYCSNDFGPGWVYTDQREQAGCAAGWGKGTCREDPTRRNLRYINNCVPLLDLDNNANAYCNTDQGKGWVYANIKEQAGCTPGFGKALCTYDQSKQLDQYQKNCAPWASIEAAGDQWCYNDFGSGWRYVGREQAGCTVGFGKGICRKT